MPSSRRLAAITLAGAAALSACAAPRTERLLPLETLTPLRHLVLRLELQPVANDAILTAAAGAPIEPPSTPRVDSELKLWSVSPALLAGLLPQGSSPLWAVVVPRAQARALLADLETRLPGDRPAVECLMNSSLGLCSGKRGSLSLATNPTAYVRSFEIQSGAQGAIADPVIDVLREVLCWELLPEVQPTRQRTSVQLKLLATAFEQPFAQRDVRLGAPFSACTVQDPRGLLLELSTSCELAQDEALVVGLGCMPDSFDTGPWLAVLQLDPASEHSMAACVAPVPATGP